MEIRELINRINRAQEKFDLIKVCLINNFIKQITDDPEQIKKLFNKQNIQNKKTFKFLEFVVDDSAKG